MSNLASIQKNLAKPPRLVIYGVPGVGKTTIAAAAPKPVFIPIEDGLCSLDVDAFPQPKSLSEVREDIGSLISEDHDYETLVIDCADAMEPMVWANVCEADGKESIADFGYGKGYDKAGDIWRDLLKGLDILRDKGMMIIMIAHSTVVRFESPDSDGYDRWDLRLHKRAKALLCDWADAILFANHETNVVSTNNSERKRGISTGKRVLHTVEKAAWTAKNRYNLPPTIPLSWSELETGLRA